MNVDNFKIKDEKIRFEIDLYPNFILQRSNIVPTNVFELGSHVGDDAEYLRSCFDLPPESVFCFEPNPDTFQELTRKYPNFNNLQLGLGNKTESKTFYCVTSDAGVSSCRKKINLSPEDSKPVTVDIVRMDYIIDHYQIQSIDLCKIDVEGCSYEVLEGFGDKLTIVKSLQIESEKIPLFEGQKSSNDVFRYLENHGFYMVNYFDLGCQCDSLWFRHDLFLIK